MKCPNCNADIADGDKFCGNCGSQLPQHGHEPTMTRGQVEIFEALENELQNLPLSQAWGTSLFYNPAAIREGDTYKLYDQRCDMELYQFIRNKTFEILIRPKYYPCDMPVASQILDFSRTLTQWHDFLTGLGLKMKDHSFGKNHPRGNVLSGSLCFGSSQSPIAFMLSFDDVLINEPCSVSVCYLINNRINQIF